MSYSLRARGVDVYSVRSAVLAELESWLASVRVAGVVPASVCEPVVRDAVDAAVRAAELLVRSALAGCRPDFVCDVEVSGHANPASLPVDGSERDSVSVRVSNASRSPRVQAEDAARAEARRVADAVELARVAREERAAAERAAAEEAAVRLAEAEARRLADAEALVAAEEARVAAVAEAQALVSAKKPVSKGAAKPDSTGG